MSEDSLPDGPPRPAFNSAGDAVRAIFNFPIERDNHVENAVLAELALQESCASLRSIGRGESQLSISVGVGIHTGTAAIVDVGQVRRDFTAVGSVVNRASRLQGAARPGEILVTESVYRCVAEQVPNAQKRVCQLNEVEQPVSAWSL